MGICSHGGLDIHVVMTRMPTPYIDSLATDLRHRIFKSNFIYVKQSRYFIEKILDRKSIVVFATDVDYGYRGIFVPFMGRKISMGRGPAHYALKHNAPLILVIIFRDEKGTQYLHGEEIEIIRTGDVEKDVYELTAKLASRMEFWIRRYPDQWFSWILNPWKTRPLEELEARLVKDPNNAAVLEQIGLYYAAKEKYEEAKETFHNALRIDPNRVRAHSELGKLLLQDRAIEKAIYHLDRALEINPKDLRSLKCMGHCFLTRELPRTALKYFGLATKVKYDDPEAYWGKGQCLEKLGKLKKAIATYQKGIKINYDYGPLHLAMARIYVSQPDKKKSLDEHLEALKKLRVEPPQEVIKGIEKTWGKDSTSRIFSENSTQMQ
jgi:tetratricopeptide (TPR) repeat protein